MLPVGDKFPAFKLKGVVGLDKDSAFKDFTDQSDAGKWKVYFFWPMDFTFICPTEIVEFSRKAPEFAERDAVVYGISTDTHFVHLGWRNAHADLRDITIPMLADTRRELSTALGVLHKQEGVPLRATYIVDPENTIRHVSVNDLSVGRNVDETLRILEAFETGELCQVGWRPGMKTLNGEGRRKAS